MVDRAAADNETARQARAWLDELRAGVDLTFFHGISIGTRVDGPFCYPAPKLEIEDYDRIRDALVAADAPLLRLAPRRRTLTELFQGKEPGTRAEEST